MRNSKRTTNTKEPAAPGFRRPRIVEPAPRSPATPVVTRTETNYFDFDGDGLLDAVEVVETVFTVDQCSGERRAVHVDRTVSAGIGVDGMPQRVLRSSSQIE